MPPVVRLPCQSNHQTMRSLIKYSKEYFLWLNFFVASPPPPPTLLLEPEFCLHFLWMLCGTSEHMLSSEPFDTLTPLSKSCIPLGRMVPPFHAPPLQLVFLTLAGILWSEFFVYFGQSDDWTYVGKVFYWDCWSAPK